MSKLLIISVHDVSPAFEKEIKIILKKLNEIGINKKSLLLVPNYERKYDLRKYPKFIARIKKEKQAEIVTHGFYHESDKDIISRIIYFLPKGVNEFKNIELNEAKVILSDGKKIIKKVFGKTPSGFIAPNWSMNRQVKKEIFKVGYNYFTTLSRINFRDKTIFSLAYGFSDGNNKILEIIIKYFSYIRLKLYWPKIIRFAIHPKEAENIGWECNLIKDLLGKGYKQITFSELRREINR